MADPIKPEVTERDRELSDKIYYEDPDKDVVTSLIAAYREECVRVMAVAMQEAIDREVAARVKVEQELAELKRQMVLLRLRGGEQGGGSCW